MQCGAGMVEHSGGPYLLVSESIQAKTAITHLPTLLLHLCMLPTQHLGAEIHIILSRHSPQIGLSSELDTLVVGEVDMLYERVYIEWVEV